MIAAGALFSGNCVRISQNATLSAAPPPEMQNRTSPDAWLPLQASEWLSLGRRRPRAPAPVQLPAAETQEAVREIRKACQRSPDALDGFLQLVIDHRHSSPVAHVGQAAVEGKDARMAHFDGDG
ncbi:MAG: hypothetical protein ACTHMG_11355 [Sphingomonas sp.]